MVWLTVYLCLIPIFALIYQLLPDSQFRIPGDDMPDYGSWLYYSIVTITTLGFGDYTPAHGAAQCVTSIEAVCGVVFLGLFMNAVAAMKSEIDVSNEREKQRLLHEAAETDKLKKSTPIVLAAINSFINTCWLITTSYEERSRHEGSYNPEFLFKDLSDLFQPIDNADEYTVHSTLSIFLKSASKLSLSLDSLQQKVDLTLWPDLLEDSFSFVADYQIFSNNEYLLIQKGKVIEDKENDISGSSSLLSWEEKIAQEIANWESDKLPDRHSHLYPFVVLYHFIKTEASKALSIERLLTIQHLELNHINQNQS